MERAKPTPSAATRRLSRAGLERAVDDLEAKGPPSGISIYTGPGYTGPGELPGQVEGELRLPRLPESMMTSLAASPTGAAVFWSPDRAMAILPPFLLNTQGVFAVWNVAPLRDLLEREMTLGVVLLRLGKYAVGVFRGQSLVASKVDSRYVKGRHSAGGQSQMRFQRIREKQVHVLFQKVCAIAREKLAPFEASLDQVFLGGEKFTLTSFLKECDYIRGFGGKISPRTLNIRDPGRQTLERSIDAIWESTLLEVPESSG